jgi:hypothetical protein
VASSKGASKAAPKQNWIGMVGAETGVWYEVIAGNTPTYKDSYTGRPFYSAILNPGTLIKIQHKNMNLECPTPYAILTLVSATVSQDGVESIATTTAEDGGQTLRLKPLAESDKRISKLNSLMLGLYPSSVFSKSGMVYATGADPEVFIVKPDEDGSDVVVPAWEVLPSKSEYHGYYWDGYQAEFAPSAGSCHTELTDRFRRKLSNILYAARKHVPKAKLSWASVLPVSPESLLTAEDRFVALGCSPSLNAYDEEPPEGLRTDPRQLPFRCAGFHVHFSGDGSRLTNSEYDIRGLSDDRIKRLVRGMDAIAGVASVAILRGMEDPLRRRLYGRAGEFRRPSHGVEYRVFPSSGLASPALVNILLDLARTATNLEQQNGKSWGYFAKYDPALVQDIINHSDVREALRFIRKNQAIFDGLLSVVYGKNSTPMKAAQVLIMEGAINCIDLSDMERNWRIGNHSEAFNAYTVGQNNSVRGLGAISPKA